MKHLYILLIAVTLFSCGKGKSVLLPEIEHAEITEIHDVSHAYLFYDETQPDSVELNRKNLISTTNWLINVDKRLTLEQAIPKIKFLQDKKRNAKMHKNENAKNYYTCNDTSIENLGFLEFTDVVYEKIMIDKDSTNIQTQNSKDYHLRMAGFHANSTVSVFFDNGKKVKIENETIDINALKDKLKFFLENYNFIGIYLDLYFNKEMSFQDYISIKSELSKIELDLVSFDKNEFIY
ncbi:hypothetical protein [uncultured Psychroserpens sp.]|uniref:hypothetical protein n=1 Tax=uncultured Psychroserpens sp. TaxID=255436 RepID=UPI00261FC30F|nr:hypothetical protein [uncultured Psychroserpens sp.]